MNHQASIGPNFPLPFPPPASWQIKNARPYPETSVDIRITTQFAIIRFENQNGKYPLRVGLFTNVLA
jgi:hypothetical protein